MPKKEAAVGLFHPKTFRRGDEKTTQFGVRMPDSLLKFLDEEKEVQGRDRTEILLGAMVLYRDLQRALTPLKQRIARAALDESLDWPTQEVEVLRRLIERGLKDSERTGRR